MSLISPPPDFPPEGFTLYEDILDAEEVFDDGTYEPNPPQTIFGFPVVVRDDMPQNVIELRDEGGRVIGRIRYIDGEQEFR